MRALVYTGPERMEVRDVPEPIAGEGEALVKVAHVGICGSDMHAYLGHDERRPAPLILGHEAAGVILGGPRDGARVTINPLVGCGLCSACLRGQQNICGSRQIISMPPREGAFAQFVVLPDENLIDVGGNMSLEKAALAEPLAVSWHAARLGLRAIEGPAERALVFGGGAIGLGSALCLRAQGVRDTVIVEPHDARRDLLQNSFAEKTCNVDEAGALAGFDLVVDAVGIDATRKSAVEQVRAGGAVLHIGLGPGSGGLDIRRMTLQEISFIGTYTYTPDDFRQTVAAMMDGRLGALDWTEARHLEDGSTAFRDLKDGKVVFPKIVLATD